MSEKEKRFIEELIGINVERVLTGLDSYYAEGMEEEFIGLYGVTFKEARSAVRKFVASMSRG